MFKSLPIKSQAARLGDLFSQHGIVLTRAQKLEALAHVHGAANWQTLRSAMVDAVEAENIESTRPSPYAFGRFKNTVLDLNPHGPSTHVVGESGKPYMTIKGQTEGEIALGIFEAALIGDEKPAKSVWVSNEDGSSRLMALRLHDTPAQVPAMSVYPILADGSAAEATTWAFQHDLSDAEGNFNRAQLERKPYLASPEFDVDLWNECMSLLMLCEHGYIGCLDGKLGVYFEQEYMCQESETEEGEEPVNFPTRSERVRILQRSHAPLVNKYPEVSFGVSNELEYTWAGRPSIWAFYPASRLEAGRAMEMCTAMLDDMHDLAYPD